jgi:predicted nucleic acid-binding protein
MVRTTGRLAEAFLDAAYAIALSAPGDQFHAQAEALAERMERDGMKLVTTRAVLLEIGNALGKQRHRAAAVALLRSKRVGGRRQGRNVVWKGHQR